MATQDEQVEQLRTLLNAGTTTTDAELVDSIEVAVEMIATYLNDNGVAVDGVPSKVLDRATRAVAREMFNQDEAPNGVLNQQYDTIDGLASTPVRISADPLRPAYALLGMWVDPVSFA